MERPDLRLEDEEWQVAVENSKWTGFGGSRSSSSNRHLDGSNSNYNALHGIPSRHAEALMRKLADYAFMATRLKASKFNLRLLRSDFSNDKAWKYHAAANEWLLSPVYDPRKP